MALYTFRAFYLGVGGDIDPDENNFVSENAGSWIGMTFGGPGNALVDTALVDLTTDDANNDGLINDNDAGQTPETLSSVEGTAALDSTVEYFVTLTYTDGTTANAAIVLLQDTAGRVYLTSFNNGNSFNDPLNDKPIQSIRLDSGRNANYQGLIASDRSNGFVTCFAAGTMIDAPGGARAVQNLKVGDLLHTKDKGPQPILHISRTRCTGSGAGGVVCIMPDALERGRPSRPLMVSRQHRMVVRGHAVKKAFGAREVLVPAIKLTTLKGVTLRETKDPVEFYHFLLPGHFIIRANNALSETLYVGPMVMRSNAYREACEVAFAQGHSNMLPARPLIDGKQAKQIISEIAAHKMWVQARMSVAS